MRSFWTRKQLREANACSFKEHLLDCAQRLRYGVAVYISYIHIQVLVREEAVGRKYLLLLLLLPLLRVKALYMIFRSFVERLSI